QTGAELQRSGIGISLLRAESARQGQSSDEGTGDDRGTARRQHAHESSPKTRVNFIEWSRGRVQRDTARHRYHTRAPPPRRRRKLASRESIGKPEANRMPPIVRTVRR